MIQWIQHSARCIRGYIFIFLQGRNAVTCCCHSVLLGLMNHWILWFPVRKTILRESPWKQKPHRIISFLSDLRERARLRVPWRKWWRLFMQIKMRRFFCFHIPTGLLMKSVSRWLLLLRQLILSVWEVNYHVMKPTAGIWLKMNYPLVTVVRKCTNASGIVGLLWER